MDLMDLVAHRVKILHQGVWTEDQIDIRQDEKFIPLISKEMRMVAEKRFSERKAENPRLFDGNAFHLDLANSVIQQNRISLAAGRIKYSIYDIARQEYIDKYGWENVPMGMGLCMVVITSDSKIIMHNRYSWVDKLGEIALIGGIIQQTTLFDEARRELKEELTLEKKEINKMCLLGILHRLDERMNNEFTFLVKISLSANQIIEREKTLKEREGEIFFLNCLPREIKRYLKNNYEKIASAHFAALVIAGHHLWGSSWSQIDKI